jgi:hypothetical protein
MGSASGCTRRKHAAAPARVRTRSRAACGAAQRRAGAVSAAVHAPRPPARALPPHAPNPSARARVRACLDSHGAERGVELGARGRGRVAEAGPGVVRAARHDANAAAKAAAGCRSCCTLLVRLRQEDARAGQARLWQGGDRSASAWKTEAQRRGAGRRPARKCAPPAFTHRLRGRARHSARRSARRRAVRRGSRERPRRRLGAARTARPHRRRRALGVFSSVNERTGHNTRHTAGGRPGARSPAQSEGTEVAGNQPLGDARAAGLVGLAGCAGARRCAVLPPRAPPACVQHFPPI